MGNGLSISGKKIVTMAVGLFIVAWLAMMLPIILGSDELVKQTFSNISKSTRYTLVTEESVTSGLLGKFFNCLNDYRPIYQLRSKTGDVVHAKLIVSSTTYFEFSIVGNEAFRFYIVHSKDGLDVMEKKVFKQKQDSDSYAINCDLGLLNQLEPDN